ncbi:MAG: hypothetical protein AAFX50_06370 [Acidobacteriota bacterium]
MMHRYPAAALAALACLFAAPPSPAHAQPPAAPAAAPASTVDVLTAREAEWLHGTARTLLHELIELSGDFDGYGGALWEVTDPVEPPPAELRSILRTELTAALDPAAAAAGIAFWESPVGQKILWLRREAASRSGRRGLARSAREIAERTARDDPERYAKVLAIDAASLDTESTLSVGAALFLLIDDVALRIESAIGEEVEWAQEPSEILDEFRGPYREGLQRELVYLTSRLSFDELDALLAYAQSPAGRAYFEARRAALTAAAEVIVDTLLPRVHASLDEELRQVEAERENEGEDEDEDEDEDR